MVYTMPEHIKLFFMYTTLKTVLSALAVFVLATSCEKAFSAFPVIPIPYDTTTSSEDDSASSAGSDSASTSAGDSTVTTSLEGQLWSRIKTYHMVMDPKGNKVVFYTYRCVSFDSASTFSEFLLRLPKDTPLLGAEPLEGTLRRGRYSLSGNVISFSGTSLDSGFLDGNNMTISEWGSDGGEAQLIATTLTLYVE